MKARKTISFLGMSAVLTAAVFVLTASLGSICYAKENVTISGAGATFPYPVYAAWAPKYKELKRL